MESTNNTPSPISPMQLLERQLNDWHRLANRLHDQDPNDPNLAYCEKKIDELDAEIERLKA